jgi:hypothetical protein
MRRFRRPVLADGLKLLFNGGSERADLDRLQARNVLAQQWRLVMSKTSTKVVLALLAVLAAPAASFARAAGEAGMGNVPISGIAPGPANAGGMNNATVDPSGIGNANKIARIPPPRISAPVIPKFK